MLHLHDFYHFRILSILFFSYLSLNHSLFIFSSKAVMAVKLQIWNASYIFSNAHYNKYTTRIYLAYALPKTSLHALRNSTVKVSGRTPQISLPCVLCPGILELGKKEKAIPLTENFGDLILRHWGLLTLFWFGTKYRSVWALLLRERPKGRRKALA